MGTAAGRTKYIETPEKLWEFFQAYRKDVKENTITINGFKNYCKNKVGTIHTYFSNRDNQYNDFKDVVNLIKDEIFKCKLDLYKRGLLHHQKICKEASTRNVDIKNTPFFVGKTNTNQFIIEDGIVSIDDSLLKKKSHTAKSMPNTKPPDTIYVLNISGTNIYKIGTSQNVKRRIKDICVANPFHIDVIYINKMIFAYEVEQSIHKLLDEYHVKNEWFKIKDIDSIIKMIKNV